MKNSTTKPASTSTSTSTGDQALYAHFSGKRITATFSRSNAGTGWRRVCNGRFIGNQCSSTERAAIEYGTRVFLDLKSRVVPTPKKRRSKKQ